jgi:hypothetical protein
VLVSRFLQYCLASKVEIGDETTLKIGTLQGSYEVETIEAKKGKHVTVMYDASVKEGTLLLQLAHDDEVLLQEEITPKLFRSLQRKAVLMILSCMSKARRKKRKELRSISLDKYIIMKKKGRSYCLSSIYKSNNLFKMS